LRQDTGGGGKEEPVPVQAVDEKEIKDTEVSNEARIQGWEHA